MLLSFSIENFRSFREEQTLSMVASNRQVDHPEHTVEIPDDDNRALPVAVIYGANGAGKSNLIHALGFLQALVLRGTEPKKPIGRRAFIFDKESASKPTEFKLQYVDGKNVYAFGCRISDKLVEAEWLSLLRDGKEISVYERATASDGEVKIAAGPVLKDGSWGDHRKALALTDVGVLPNQLFLHAVGKNLREQDQGPVMSGALRWFTEQLTVIPADSTFAALAQLVAQDEKFTNFAGDFLRRVATGVDKLRVDTSQVEESFLSGLGHHFQEIVKDMPVGESSILAGPDGTELLVEKGEGTKVRVRIIKSEHVTADGSRVTLPFSEESDGTQRLTHLLPALHAIYQKQGLFVIDEIDRSLHPLLAKKFVRTFLQLCAGKGSQLIFTTHETAFLDLDLLRRDEIWFADKRQKEGTTELYSLADYKVRTDLKIDKAYLQGRFEAVPPIEQELPDWIRQIMDELKPKSPGASTTSS
jgi:AAA15 family ATPase/GTPase